MDLSLQYSTFAYFGTLIFAQLKQVLPRFPHKALGILFWNPVC